MADRVGRSIGFGGAGPSHPDRIDAGEVTGELLDPEGPLPDPPVFFRPPSIVKQKWRMGESGVGG
jgi:hypothetical protein